MMRIEGNLNQSPFENSVNVKATHNCRSATFIKICVAWICCSIKVFESDVKPNADWYKALSPNLCFYSNIFVLTHCTTPHLKQHVQQFQIEPDAGEGIDSKDFDLTYIVNSVDDCPLLDQVQQHLVMIFICCIPQSSPSLLFNVSDPKWRILLRSLLLHCSLTSVRKSTVNADRTDRMLTFDAELIH